MSTKRWSVATAKAELSRLLRSAQRTPQVIETRGQPVAVVMSFDDYRSLAERERRLGRWKSFLDLSAGLRAQGGADLEIPVRHLRPSPFTRRRA
ncbi:MAG TPA: type II toxin-antitoxin system Phd/YefM family antitoxin [Vicinamibacterales bacterium]